MGPKISGSPISIPNDPKITKITLRTACGHYKNTNNARDKKFQKSHTFFVKIDIERGSTLETFCEADLQIIIIVLFYRAVHSYFQALQILLWNTWIWDLSLVGVPPRHHVAHDVHGTITSYQITIGNSNHCNLSRYHTTNSTVQCHITPSSGVSHWFHQSLCVYLPSTLSITIIGWLLPQCHRFQELWINSVMLVNEVTSVWVLHTKLRNLRNPSVGKIKKMFTPINKNNYYIVVNFGQRWTGWVFCKSSRKSSEFICKSY